ncbi:hypothetical protein LB554_17930 [Mesorhizobium sp. CO1-1-11]|uniref:hypothetical protein n=1 Tax=Mesorhizobium sp. CO1-1-11 TaxID=2876636 RepID=UPI001CC92BEB|nr:hypothetical protein [Mesorhizobium sp. CO1-1-11]MBZ9725827.1 hypothetical protein [Mesorhizobium sp. CO1-1-11]
MLHNTSDTLSVTLNVGVVTVRIERVDRLHKLVLLVGISSRQRQRIVVVEIVGGAAADHQG